MRRLVAEPFFFIRVQLGEILKVLWILGNERAFLQKRQDVVQVVFFGKMADITE